MRDWPAALRARTRLGAVLERQNLDLFDVGQSLDEFYATSSVTPLRSYLALRDTDKTSDKNDYDCVLYVVALMERNYALAEQAMARVSPEFLEHIDSASKTISLAVVQLARHEAPDRIAATLAPDFQLAQDKITKDPGNFVNRSSSGILLAMAGKKGEAIREGERGVQLAPAKFKDWAFAQLAFIYARTDQENSAVQLLEILLTRPGLVDSNGVVSITLAGLRLNPQWDPLRENPRFRQLLAGPEPSTILTLSRP